MNYKILNIKGALLDTQQLEDYLRNSIWTCIAR